MFVSVNLNSMGYDTQFSGIVQNIYSPQRVLNPQT